jgi:hypothetical protein
MTLKTSANISSVEEFLNFQKVTEREPIMWGPSIIGFGKYSYTRSDKKTYDFLATGFGPRKANLTIYIIPGHKDFQEELAKLGKHKLGQSCPYINKLDDVDIEVLAKIVDQGFEAINETHVEC